MAQEFEEEPSERELLVQLSICEITARLKGVLKISHEQWHNKECLLDHVVDHAPSEHFEFLCNAGQEKMKAMEKEGRQGQIAATRKCKRTEEAPQRCIAPRIDEVCEEDDYNPSQFLWCPSDEEVKECYRKFFNATSNAALQSGTCSICARECSTHDDGLTEVYLDCLSNADRLVPKRAHPRHDLFDGKLLEPSAVKTINGRHLISICSWCSDDLKKSSNKPPRYTLANQLWIGKVPWQLQVLTFPEQLLVSLVYPRVFVFKLFPKRSGGVRDVSGLQRAMRGNVSSYELDMQGIASMVEGKLMPRPPALLASLISVTFIALGQLPKLWIHSTFWVRRQVVLDALLWLKENNPRYYGDIEISAPHMDSLPEDDIP